jgi:hypothetical protein
MLSTGSYKSHYAAIFLAEAQRTQRYIIVVALCELGALARVSFSFSRLFSDPAVTPVLLLTEITKVDFCRK